MNSSNPHTRRDRSLGLPKTWRDLQRPIAPRRAPEVPLEQGYPRLAYLERSASRCIHLSHRILNSSNLFENQISISRQVVLIFACASLLKPGVSEMFCDEAGDGNLRYARDAILFCSLRTSLFLFLGCFVRVDEARVVFVLALSMAPARYNLDVEQSRSFEIEVPGNSF